MQFLLGIFPNFSLQYSSLIITGAILIKFIKWQNLIANMNTTNDCVKIFICIHTINKAFREVLPLSG